MPAMFWTFPAFFVVCFFLSVSPSTASLSSPDTRPGCMDKCSDQVECRVTYSHCLHDFTNSKFVASRATGFQVIRSRDKKYKYLDLEWTPPDDGSFRDLKGFDVAMTFISHDHQFPGTRGELCFKVDIVDPHWIETYSNSSVKFYLHCARLTVKDHMTVHATIVSSPVNINRPKSVSEKITIEPDRIEQWNPKIKNWTDADTNDVHILVTNPHPDAKYYEVVLHNKQPDSKHFAWTYSGTLPAQYKEVKDQARGMTLPSSNETQTEFLIKNVPTNGTYIFILRGLNENKTLLPDATVGSRNATFVFHPKKKVPGTPTSVSSSEAVTTKRDKGMSGSTLILVVVGVALGFMLVTLVLWKFMCQSTASPWATCKFLVPSLSNNAEDLPKIVPLYCEENEDFVRAVESHVDLLRQYVNVLPNPQYVGSRSSGSQWCPLLPQTSLLTESESKVTDMIIYLSPGLGRLVQQQQPTNVNTHHHRLSRLDELCQRRLQTLELQRRSSHRGEFTVHVVTFDCFQNNELDCLPTLSNLLALDTTTNTPVPAHHTTTTHAQRSIGTTTTTTPIKLATFKQNSWKLENLDQLLCDLSRVRDFPQELPMGMMGWRESPQAKVVEQYLDRFGTPPLLAATMGNNSQSQSQSTSLFGTPTAIESNSTSNSNSNSNSISNSPRPNGHLQTGFVPPPPRYHSPNGFTCAENETTATTAYHQIEPYDYDMNCGGVAGVASCMDDALPSYHSSQAVESGCVSAGDSGGFYNSTEKVVLYTKPPSVLPENLTVDLPVYRGQGHSVYYAAAPHNQHQQQQQQQQHHHHHHQQQQQQQQQQPYSRTQQQQHVVANKSSDDHVMNIFNPPQGHKGHQYHQHSHPHQYIKPPPPPSPMISQHQNNNYHCNGRSNSNNNSAADSESDNENFSSSLESDTLLSTINHNSNALDVSGHRSGSNLLYSLKNHPANAISPPSSLDHHLKDSTSNLIEAQNTTTGWDDATSSSTQSRKLLHFGRAIKLDVNA